MSDNLSDPLPAAKNEAGGSDYSALTAGICQIRNRTVVSANPRCCEMLGYAAEELVGQLTQLVFASEAEYARVGQVISQDLEKHGAGICCAQMRRKDGSVMDVALTTINPRANQQDDAITFVLVDITKARLSEQELFWQNRELTAFHRISEVMLSGKPEQEIFDTIAREASGMTDFPMVSIELCDFERAVMVYRGAYGIPLHEMPTPFEVPMDVSLSGQVAYSGEILVEQNVSDCREYAAPILRLLGVRTFVCVPIKSEGKIMGTLSLSHREMITVGPRVINAAASLANYLATMFDRLQAHEAVNRSESELSTVYERVPSVLCLFDERLNVVRANLAAMDFVGHDLAAWRPQPLGDFFACVSTEKRGGCPPQSACLSCTLREILAETLATGRSLRQTRLSKTLVRNGVARQIELLASTERIHLGHTVRVLVCLEDITQSVRADEQIRSQAALLDITGDAIFVRDFSDRISYWNEGARRLYGWSAAEVLGHTTSELSLSSDLFESSRALQTVQGKGEWVGELRQKSRDGRELVIQSRWTLMREPDGRPKAILIVNTDITQKKQLESQLLRSQRLESIGTLASGLAHDLNNVLAPIMMAVQFIKDSSEDEGVKACFQTLETCSRRGADIIRQVLMFARGVEGDRILVNPKHLIQEMERIAHETFPRSIEIVASFSKQPCVLLGDATQIQQVIMNLCVNARDAMPQGGTLTLSLKRVELDAEGAKIHPKAKPGTYVVIAVADTGTGIPPELMDKIFDPFFTTKPLGQGTGLGLPTVMGIAENHGGFVHLTSQVGKGTTFEVYIPAAPEEMDGGELRKGVAELVRGSGELILVVDDEAAVRRLVGAILSRNGYRTLTAGEGREGLTLFEANRKEIKLVVSDLMMPQLDGLGMLRALKKLQPDIKSIIITGLGEENRIAEARAAGANMILSKPFTSDQLLHDINQLLG
jgi:PAS domain S-box-containing protein